jgi:lipopolysaccharide transport protein LptA
MRKYMPHLHAKRRAFERASVVAAFGCSVALTALAPVGAALGAASAPAETAEKCDNPVCLSAASTEATPTHLILHSFRIVYTSRGTTVTGDLAEGDSAGSDTRNTTWVLTGHVLIIMPQGILRADRATMQIVSGRITSMTAQGTPAEFERNPDSTLPAGSNPNAASPSEHAHGHAREIIYDLEHGELQLNGDSYLSNGCYEFSSEHMSYDITNQRVHADPGDSSGVHGIVRDRASSACPGAGKS